MADDYTQSNRPMAVSSPDLKADSLLLVSLSGQEGLSQLFNFQVRAVAKTKTKIAFEDLLGKPFTVRINEATGKQRFINGICQRIAQGESDGVFTNYVIDIVPKLWLLSKRSRSRIFMRQSVPDILKKVLTGIDVALQLKGTFEPRDYCVQYRETDFNFASRLMEEEGIYYFFKHTDTAHQLVLANAPDKHPPLVGGPDITFNQHAGNTEQAGGRVFAWAKRQEVRAGVYTLRDHCFELAHQPLEGTKKIRPSAVMVGQVPHQLTAGNNAALELYDWPGEYAQRFDGIDPGGGEQPAELKKISSGSGADNPGDKDRTASIRMDQEAVPALVIHGSGDSPRFTAGHQFKLATLANDEAFRQMKADGSYVLVTVTHAASQGDYRSGGNDIFRYQNNFTAIPFELPFRPPRDTPKPFVQGLQTAVVVGPAGQELFTDKWGRVKVQFHWDREGKSDANSSCWIRVAQIFAGKRWGASFWPRIGQEVVVAFQEGDPDQPIIIGSVYNSDQPPPYLGDGLDSKHKTDNKVSGVKTNTTLGGSGYNEWRFDDTKGKEQVFIHAERDYDLRVKNESRERIVSNSHLVVGSDKDGKKSGDLREKVFQDVHRTVERNQIENIKGNIQLLVGGGDGDNGNVDMVLKKDLKEKIGGEQHTHVVKNRLEKVDGAQSLTVGGDQQEKVSKNHALDAGMAIHIKAGTTLVIEAGTQLSLKVGGNFVDISAAGVTIKGTAVLINSGGAAGSGAGSSPTAPQDAKEAAPTKPDDADFSASGLKSAK